MIKQVPVSQLRPGMFLQRLDVRWTDHPFWRGSFVLGPDDTQKIAETGIATVWIDTDKGLDALVPAGAEMAFNFDALARPSDDRPGYRENLIENPIDNIGEDKGAEGNDSAQTASRNEPDIEADAPIAQPEVNYIDMPEDVAPAEPALDMPLAMPEVKELAIHEANRLCINATGVLKKLFADIRLGRALDSEQCSAIVKDVVELVMEDPAALILVARLKNHDDYSYMHSVATCTLMVALSRQLGLSHEEQCSAGLAGLTHDVGKLMVPTDLLNKPSPLTPAEYAVVKTHVHHGHSLLLESGVSNKMVLDVCLHHHERLNGTGYPHGLRGAEITLYARMAGICDVYDALTSKRPHRGRVEPGLALRQMISQSGQFDLRVLQAFVKAVGIYPIGSLVRLRSQELAIVVGQDTHSLLRPQVRSFYSLSDRRPLVAAYLSLAEGDNGILQLETPESLGEEVMRHLRKVETVLRADD